MVVYALYADVVELQVLGSVKHNSIMIVWYCKMPSERKTMAQHDKGEATVVKENPVKTCFGK